MQYVFTGFLALAALLIAWGCVAVARLLYQGGRRPRPAEVRSSVPDAAGVDRPSMRRPAAGMASQAAPEARPD
jgi:hypothetical protein